MNLGENAEVQGSTIQQSRRRRRCQGTRRGLPGRDQRAAEFALWLSPHILANTGRVLATVLKTPDEEVDAYLQVLAEMTEASGGGITDPPQTVGDCPD